MDPMIYDDTIRANTATTALRALYDACMADECVRERLAPVLGMADHALLRSEGTLNGGRDERRTRI